MEIRYFFLWNILEFRLYWYFEVKRNWLFFWFIIKGIRLKMIFNYFNFRYKLVLEIVIVMNRVIK